MTEIEINQEKEDYTKIKIEKKILYPTNPLHVFKEFKNLNKSQIIKLSISGVIIILFGIFNNIKIIKDPNLDNHCYYDVVLEWFRPYNDYFRGSKVFCSFMLIMGSVLIDIVFIVTYFGWALYAVDWRFSVTTMFFYGTRGLIQEIMRFTVPDRVYFPNPGFPSIVVTYIQGSDFFFSGHCGFPIIGMLEFIWMKRYYWAAYFGFVSFVEMILMAFLTREHYTIDMIVGIVFAHYITVHSRTWFKYIYDHFAFLDKLKQENRKELKRINFNFDIGD